MRTSEQIDKIAPAFIKAQADFGKAVKDSSNPFFKSKYADLNAYLDATSESLSKHGLAVLQDTSGSEEGQIIKVSTRLLHTSGQWMESEPLVLHPTDMKPQSFGSAQTYGRRYSLASFLGLGAEDDDGNRASKPPEFPTRASVNKALKDMTEIGEFETYAKTFQAKHGNGAFEMRSGHKQELWKHLFATHKKRVNGENPVDANQSPQELQAEWIGVVKKCQNMETYKILEDMINQNRALDTTENWAEMEELHKEIA